MGETGGELEPAAVAVPDPVADEAALVERITALERVFRDYAETVAGLSVGVVGRWSGRADLVHPVAGFEVRLERADGRTVSLYISGSYAELRRRVGAGGGPAILRETFVVRLSEGYAWGDFAYPDADALAHELLAYLQYNLDNGR